MSPAQPSPTNPVRRPPARRTLTAEVAAFALMALPWAVLIGWGG